MRLAQMGWPPAIFFVAVAVYGCTLAPTFTWSHEGADGGDLIAAAATLGVPHPSGYPTYILLARLFLHALPLGEPAYRVHWLSALSAAATATLLGLSIIESLGAAEKQESEGATEIRDSSPSSLDSRWPAEAAATSAALLFAFSPLLWSQATIAEVHALNAAFAAAIFYLLLRWRARGSSRLVVAAAFVYGLSLGNHLIGLLILPAAICWLVTYGRRERLTRHSWLTILAAFALGLAVYVYLPLAARRQPPINWGDPQTWDRFWWVATGQLYREAIFGVPLMRMPGRLTAWGHLLVEQFGWWGWTLALTGVWRLSRYDRPALGYTLFGFAAHSLYALSYDRPDSYVYLLPACLMVAFWLGQGLATALQALCHWIQQRVALHRSPVTSLLAAVLLVVSLPLLPLAGNFAVSDLRHDREAADYATAALAAAEPGALIITSGDRATFALWYRCYALRERPDVTIVNANLWGFDWYRRTVAVHHPAAASPDGQSPPPTLSKLIRANLARRPIYVTEEARRAISSHRLEPVGPLYRLRPYKG